MPRRTQRGRLQELAEQINWKGELTELVELLYQIVGSLPPKVGEPFRSYYLEDKEVPKRADGHANIPFYQKLYEGRAALMTLGNMSPDLLNHVGQIKSLGRW